MIGFNDINLQCFKDTERAYQKVGQDSQLNVPLYIAALDAYKRHENKATMQAIECKSTSR
mgnify:FL=1